MTVQCLDGPGLDGIFLSHVYTGTPLDMMACTGSVLECTRMLPEYFGALGCPTAAWGGPPPVGDTLHTSNLPKHDSTLRTMGAQKLFILLVLTLVNAIFPIMLAVR